MRLTPILSVVAAGVTMGAIHSCTIDPEMDLREMEEEICFAASVAGESVADAGEDGFTFVDTNWNDGPEYGIGLSAATKASGEIGSLAALQQGGFGVFGCYTALHRYSEFSPTSDFMHNQEVTYNTDAGVWEYSPVKYWPVGEGEVESSGRAKGTHYVSFFAYAPFSDEDTSRPERNPAGWCIPSFCSQVELSDPWLLYRIHENPDYQVDLMYAIPLLDRYKSEAASRLSFGFRHALACAADEVRLNLTDELTSSLKEKVTGGSFDSVEFILTGLTLDFSLVSKAKMVLWNQGQANWKAIASEDPVARRTRVLVAEGTPETLYSYEASGTEHSGSLHITGKGVYFIPLSDAEQGVTVKIEYTVRTKQGDALSETKHTKSMELSLRDYAREGRKMDINISLNQQ